MSSQRGNSSRTRSQKHQNTFAFRDNKNSKKSVKIKATAVYGLCPRCQEIIQWKKKYHKYKPLTAPKKCNGCQERSITRAYMTLCDGCAKSRQACAKCGSSCLDQASPAPVGSHLTQNQRKQVLEAELSLLSERERRAVVRRIERGEEVLVDATPQCADDDLPKAHRAPHRSEPSSSDSDE